MPKKPRTASKQIKNDLSGASNTNKISRTSQTPASDTGPLQDARVKPATSAVRNDWEQNTPQPRYNENDPYQIIDPYSTYSTYRNDFIDIDTEADIVNHKADGRNNDTAVQINGAATEQPTTILDENDDSENSKSAAAIIESIRLQLMVLSRMGYSTNALYQQLNQIALDAPKTNVEPQGLIKEYTPPMGEYGTRLEPSCDGSTTARWQSTHQKRFTDAVATVLKKEMVHPRKATELGLCFIMCALGHEHELEKVGYFKARNSVKSIIKSID